MTAPTAYERGRAAGDAALRTTLLDVAGGLLVEQGSDALSMRRLAEAAGCSTAVLYRLFDGKPGIVRGLYREGFDRLRARLEAGRPSGDPMADLAALARGYRDFALAERAYYTVMFARPVPEFVPDADDVAHGRRSLQVLVEAVARAQDDGLLEAADPVRTAEVLWAAAHGVVSLQLAGHLATDAADAAFAHLTAAAIAPWRRTDHGSAAARESRAAAGSDSM